MQVNGSLCDVTEEVTYTVPLSRTHAPRLMTCFFTTRTTCGNASGFTRSCLYWPADTDGERIHHSKHTINTYIQRLFSSRRRRFSQKASLAAAPCTPLFRHCDATSSILAELRTRTTRPAVAVGRGEGTRPSPPDHYRCAIPVECERVAKRQQQLFVENSTGPYASVDKPLIASFTCASLKASTYLQRREGSPNHSENTRFSSGGEQAAPEHRTSGEGWLTTPLVAHHNTSGGSPPHHLHANNRRRNMQRSTARAAC
jgi:hypothetical protein